MEHNNGTHSENVQNIYLVVPLFAFKTGKQTKRDILILQQALDVYVYEPSTVVVQSMYAETFSSSSLLRLSRQHTMVESQSAGAKIGVDFESADEKRKEKPAFCPSESPLAQHQIYATLSHTHPQKADHPAKCKDFLLHGPTARKEGLVLERSSLGRVGRKVSPRYHNKHHLAKRV